VKFYDPHPGVLGCPTPMPAPLVALAKELDGKRISIKAALAKITPVLPENCRVEAKKECVVVYQGSFSKMKRDGSVVNCWRMLRYKR
jgi:hypothetical protein